MRNWEEDDPDSPCPADRDRKDAVAVCAQLGIPFHHRNFSQEYMAGVFAHFLSEYRRGRTPNPDVLCNREIKFKTFLDTALELGADCIATGHYARVGQGRDGFELRRARDSNKDQSYFLHALGQQQLAATRFPLGELTKPEVRALAREAELPVHGKKDSTGICFIGERDFRSFLAQYIPARPGRIEDPNGTRLGEHLGVMYYTLGQRQGLGLGGRAGSPAAPWYVVGKDVGRNLLVVAQGSENPWLMADRLLACDLHWVAGKPPAAEFDCQAKIRYRQADQACRVELDGDRATVRFAQPQRAVAPGQSVVFYDGEVCLGGGIIEASDAPFGGLTTTNQATRTFRKTPA